MYKNIKRYIWNSSGIGGVEIFKNILDFFEEGVSNNKTALELTGDDVAAFCDELIHDQKNEKGYIDKWRDELNRNVKRK
jgi:DNA-binding ferritin-like protein (Dps family)